MSTKVSYLFIAQDRYSRVAKKINRQSLLMRTRFKKLGGTLRSTGSVFKKTAQSITLGFKSMAVAAIAFFGIKGFLTLGARFQDSMADLSAITGATGADLTKLQKTIFKFSKESAISADEVAEAFKLVASAKPELLDNLDALAQTTEQVLLLKNAAGIELASAANIAAQGLNIFGAGADQAARFVNVLAAGAKLGSSEIRDTGEALLIAGPGARAAGLSFEQLNAAIQATAKGGIKGSRAGTALNAIFGRLQRQGVDFQELGLQGSFETIKDRMDSLTSSTARAQFAAQIFGEEHSKVGFALMDNVQLLGQYEKSLAGTNIAQEQANLRLSTFNAKSRKMGVTIQQSLIKTFLRLEPLLSKLVDDMTAFFDSITDRQINSFVDGLKTALDVVSTIGSILGYVVDLIKIGAKPLMLLMDISSILGATASSIINGDPNESLAPLSSGRSSRTDVNVNLNAPQGVVKEIKSTTSGRVGGLNVGVNMAVAQ